MSRPAPLPAGQPVALACGHVRMVADGALAEMAGLLFCPEHGTMTGRADIPNPLQRYTLAQIGYQQAVAEADIAATLLAMAGERLTEATAELHAAGEQLDSAELAHLPAGAAE